MKNIKLPVLIICGSLTNRQNSKQLFTAVVHALQKTSDIVEVDFKGVDKITADFLADAFGQLHDYFPEELISSRLKLISLSPEMSEIYSVIMCHASQYKHNKIYQQIIDLIQRRPQNSSETTTQ